MTNLTIFNTRNVTIGILLAVVIAVPLVPAHADHAIHVPADYPTIQAAINAANAGDDIVISPGTYSEQLSISKSLDIQGSDGTTIIQAPATLVPDIFGYSNVVDVTNGATVTISKVTISGPGPTNCGSIEAGIFVSGGATLKITKSTITDIRDNPASGCQNGIGILVGRAAKSTTGHANISDVTVTKYQKGGIVMDGPGSTASVKDNKVSFGLSPLNIAANGIQVGRGAQATISDNKVTGNICSAVPTVCGPDLTNLNLAQATGILLYGSGSGTSVKNNEVSQNDIGIVVVNCGDPFCLTPPSTPSVEIKDNKVSSSGATGILVQDENYTVSNNKVTGPGPIGIAVIGDSLNTVATLVDNEIKGVTASIWAFGTSGHTAVAVLK